MEDRFFKDAYLEAKKAYKHNEVPVGAIIVKGDRIISRGYNKKERKKNSLYHAEMIAINKASKKLKSWRLEGCTIYVTLEPCPMCAGAIASARIDKVVYFSKDNSAKNKDLYKEILEDTRLNHKVKCEYIAKEECSQLLSKFFKEKRMS